MINPEQIVSCQTQLSPSLFNLLLIEPFPDNHYWELDILIIHCLSHIMPSVLQKYDEIYGFVRFAYLLENCKWCSAFLKWWDD